MYRGEVKIEDSDDEHSRDDDDENYVNIEEEWFPWYGEGQLGVMC